MSPQKSSLWCSRRKCQCAAVRDICGTGVFGWGGVEAPQATPLRRVAVAGRKHRLAAGHRLCAPCRQPSPQPIFFPFGRWPQALRLLQAAITIANLSVWPLANRLCASCRQPSPQPIFPFGRWPTGFAPLAGSHHPNQSFRLAAGQQALRLSCNTAIGAYPTARRRTSLVRSRHGRKFRFVFFCFNTPVEESQCRVSAFA